MTFLNHPLYPYIPIGYLFYLADIGNEWYTQHLSQLWPYLPGITVYCLPAADYDVTLPKFVNGAG